MLVIFSGLPGVGKSTIAQALARKLQAVYLRADTIEQGLRECGVTDVGPMGYVAAYRVATENLRLGMTVVADTVNPLAVTRDAWHEAASSAGVPFMDVEVSCSDAEEHRRRVETRESEIEGLLLPTWDDIARREYEPWEGDLLKLDTTNLSARQAVDQIFYAIGRVIPL